MPAHLYSFDSVNLALALKEFDPTRNQPQPPGYPFFVVEARLLQSLFGTPERTFTVIKILVSGLAVGALYVFGKRLFSARVGAIAAALLLVNPPFWYSGLTSSLRLHAALGSILVAYCCWRAAAGEPRFFYAASLALGLASGFRPTLAVLLLPLWAWTAWQCRHKKIFLGGFLLLGMTVLVWVAMVILASGGFLQTFHSFRNYVLEQFSQTSVVMDAPETGWRRMVGRAFIWTGLGTLPWIWTLPLGWRDRTQWPEWKKRLGFLALWFLPSFLFHIFIHIGSPGHAMRTIPVLCLLGGCCVVAAERKLAEARISPKQTGSWILLLALAGNCFLFLADLPLPQRVRTTHFRGLDSIADAFRVGTYETSYARVHWTDETTHLALQEIQRLKSSTERPLFLVWTRDAVPVWRKVCYYFPSEKVYVLDEKGDPAALASMARLWVGNRVLATYSGNPPFQLPLPPGARLVWLLSPDSVDRLARSVPLQKAPPLYYTDLDSEVSRIRFGSFELVAQ